MGFHSYTSCARTIHIKTKTNKNLQATVTNSILELLWQNPFSPWSIYIHFKWQHFGYCVHWKMFSPVLKKVTSYWILFRWRALLHCGITLWDLKCHLEHTHTHTHTHTHLTASNPNPRKGSYIKTRLKQKFTNQMNTMSCECNTYSWGGNLDNSHTHRIENCS